MRIPEEWLRKVAEKYLTEEEKRIEALGGWDKLMETLKKRLEEQKGRHQGGNKWIGTGGTSPFGAYGYNPEGMRIGQHENRQPRAVKVWDKREFKNLDDSVELGTRNIKVALRRLRKFARPARPDELDLDDTDPAPPTTRLARSANGPRAAQCGQGADVLRHRRLDGLPHPHVEELFSAAQRVQALEYFYFHNCLYERVWKQTTAGARPTRRRPGTCCIPTPHDYKVIFVGDATMSPYEITYPGGASSTPTRRPGAVWMNACCVSTSTVWPNPQPEALWDYHESIGITRELMGEPHVSADARGAGPRHAPADALERVPQALRPVTTHLASSAPLLQSHGGRLRQRGKALAVAFVALASKSVVAAVRAFCVPAPNRPWPVPVPTRRARQTAASAAEAATSAARPQTAAVVASLTVGMGSSPLIHVG